MCVCVKLRGWSRAHGLANKQTAWHALSHTLITATTAHTHIKSFLSHHTSPHSLFPSWNFNTWHQPRDTPVLKITGLQRYTFSFALSLSSTETLINHVDFKQLSDRREKNMAWKPSILPYTTPLNLVSLSCFKFVKIQWQPFLLTYNHLTKP